MVSYVFAGIGAGKTCYAVRYLYKELIRICNDKGHYKHLYTNFPNELSYQVNMKDFGPHVFPDYSLVIIDEAGIDYNNRFFKKMLIETIEEFKISRHRHCDIIVISQGWDDSDVTIRRLCEEYWFLRRFGQFTYCRRIVKVTRFPSKHDKEHTEPYDYYKLTSFLLGILPFPFHQNNILLFYRKPYYKYYDSFDAPPKPHMPILRVSKLYSAASLGLIHKKDFNKFLNGFYNK